MAGALGIPIWVLLNTTPLNCLRLELCDSPWYPSVKLLRQTRAGVWMDVVERVAANLDKGRVGRYGAPAVAGKSTPAAKLNRSPSVMIRVFIGFDPVETIAYHVLSHSILTRSFKPVSITHLMLSQLSGVMTRQRHKLQSTDFSFSRFLVPHLCDFQGWS